MLSLHGELKISRVPEVAVVLRQAASASEVPQVRA